MSWIELSQQPVNLSVQNAAGGVVGVLPSPNVSAVSLATSGNGGITGTLPYANGGIGGVQAPNTFLAGPSATTSGQPVFRTIIPSFDIPSSGFSARYFSSTGAISGTVGNVVYLTKGYDDKGLYNFNTGVFTVPSSGAGNYWVSASLMVGGTIGLNSTLNLQIAQSGSAGQTSEDKIFAGGVQTDLNMTVTDIFRCQVGDTLTVRALTSITGPSIAASSSINYVSFARMC